MVKDKLFLENISQFCLDKAKKLGTTDCEIVVGNSISETINKKMFFPKEYAHLALE